MKTKFFKLSVVALTAAAMKRVIVSISMAMFTLGVFAQWQPAGDKTKTAWAFQKINLLAIIHKKYVFLRPKYFLYDKRFIV